MKKAVIIGAGISGLSLGSKLSKDYNVNIIERNSYVGGLCASFKHKDTILDYGPHKLYSQIPGIMEEFEKILGKDCLRVKKKNSLRLMGKYFEFPIKITQVIRNVDINTTYNGLGIGLGYGLSLFGNILAKKQNITYEDYFINGFGKKGYKVLFKDLAWKVWGDPNLLTEELARRRVPIPSINNLIKSFFSKSKEQEVSAEYFYYPKNGIGTVCENLAKEIKKNNGSIFLDSKPISINIKDNKVTSLTYLNNGKKETLKTDLLISTIPINNLVNLINPKPNKNILDAAKSLKYRNLIIAYLVIEKPKIIDDIWVFFVDNEVTFNRISEQKKFSRFTVPENKTVLMIDLTTSNSEELWKLPDKEIIDRIIKDLNKVKILKNEKIDDYFIKRVEKVYPLLFIDYKKNLNILLDYLDSISNLYSTGRFGMFNYNNMDHCIDMANILKEHILSGKGKSEWKQKRKYFENYKIVD